MATSIIMALLWVLWSSGKGQSRPYKRLDSILTPPEQYFYRCLASTLKDRALIMPKVRIADLIKVRRHVPRQYFWRHFSKISQKHIDFVLVDPQTFKTLCVIELDDKSHIRIDRMQRDWFVNKVMAQTGIPIYRFPVRRRYNRAEIFHVIRPSLVA
jgi:very-short-patch-repair endonuclease